MTFTVRQKATVRMAGSNNEDVHTTAILHTRHSICYKRNCGDALVCTTRPDPKHTQAGRHMVGPGPVGQAAGRHSRASQIIAFLAGELARVYATLILASRSSVSRRYRSGGEGHA